MVDMEQESFLEQFKRKLAERRLRRGVKLQEKLEAKKQKQQYKVAKQQTRGERSPLRWTKIIVIGIAVILIILVLWLYMTGNLGFFMSKADVALSESNAWIGLKKTFGGAFAFITNPAEAITKSAEWKSPVVEKNKEKQFVEFDDFKPGKSKYEYGENIILRGCVDIYGLKEKRSKFIMSCGDKGGKGEFNVYNYPGGEIDVEAGSEGKYCGVCEIKGIEKPEGISAETVRAETINFNVLSQIESKGGLNIWTVSRDEYEMAAIKGKDLLKDVSREYISSDGTAISYIDEGPLIISLGILAKLPLTNGDYAFGVNIKEDEYWKGKLKNLRELRINLPNNFEVIPERCKNFAVEGNSLILNERSNTESFKEIKQMISKDKALDYDLWCDIRLSDVRETLVELEIELDALYDYEFTKKTTANIFA